MQSYRKMMKAVRQEACLTQGEVGAWAHVTGEMVGRCERGQNKPNEAVREAILAIAFTMASQEAL